MMVSTHMSYGFLVAYLFALFFNLIFPHNSSIITSYNTFLALAGLVGGLFPDIDRLEQIGLHHRRSLHYIFGYILLAIILLVISYYTSGLPQFYLLALSCFLFGAWLHSFMDIFDGFWKSDINKGVYEHITGRWLRALNLIPFASLWEWSLQMFAATLVIAISPHLSMMWMFPGWIVATVSYLSIWVFSTGYEFYRSVPRRREMERLAYERVGKRIKYTT